MKFIKKIKRGLRIDEERRRLCIFVRCVSILFIPHYIWSLYGHLFEWYRYTLEYFIASFIQNLFFGLTFNFGLFFITMPMAKRFRKFATIVYLPTIFFTPLVLGGKVSGIYIYTLFLGSIYIYRCFNPWRK